MARRLTPRRPGCRLTCPARESESGSEPSYLHRQRKTIPCSDAPCLRPAVPAWPHSPIFAFQRRFFQEQSEGRFDEVVYRTGDIGYRNEAGDIVFVARVDRQIKHQGYRIELDDIESELRNVRGVEDAAVVHLETESSSEIVGFYTGGENGGESDVRSELTGRLPRYMVPKILHRLEAIPRTDRGKTDYKALEAECR